MSPKISTELEYFSLICNVLHIKNVVGFLLLSKLKTVGKMKRRIYKLGILQPFTAEQRIPLKEGYQVVYNLEMIFALAFQINTYPAQQLREYIIKQTVPI